MAKVIRIQKTDKEGPWQSLADSEEDNDTSKCEDSSGEITPEQRKFYAHRAHSLQKNDNSRGRKYSYLNPEKIERGQVYAWGKIANYQEKDGTRKQIVIVIQNDAITSDQTIGILCTSDRDCKSTNLKFRLNDGTVGYYSRSYLGAYADCSFFVQQIIVVDKEQLGRYLGKMQDHFMGTIQPHIDYCLGLYRTRDVNMEQIKMLATVNLHELLEIAESRKSSKRKTIEILQLFGFDMEKNGVKYLKNAILKAKDIESCTLKVLAASIAEDEDVEADEVERLMVARVKERFNARFSPTISFIRLVTRLLKKG